MHWIIIVCLILYLNTHQEPKKTYKFTVEINNIHSLQIACYGLDFVQESGFQQRNANVFG